MLAKIRYFLDGRWYGAQRPRLLTLALVTGIVILATELHRHTPISNWLLWRYASYWGVCAIWSLALVTFGHAVLARTMARVPLGEHLVYCLGVGLLAFYLGTAAAGFMGLYGTAFFVTWPLLMLGIGAPRAYRCAVVFCRRLIAIPGRRPGSVASYATLAYGSLVLTAIYLNVSIPQNAAFDARWYHLPIAEQYALTGGIVRYPEGWIIGAAPQLASLLYCWAFQAPFATLFDHVELCAHVEMTVFLWTLASIGPLTRALAPSAYVRHAWVALCLFPGILLYDSSLCVGADHITAFWAIPMFLALLRFWRDSRLRWTVLLAGFIGGALSTKFTAIVLVSFPILAFAARCVFRLVATARSRDWRGVATALALPLVACALGLSITAPHWAKNWAFYGDPLFPLLHSYLPTTPWHSEMDYRVGMQTGQLWAPTRDWNGFARTLRALFDFSFRPNDWPWMHGRVPVFGSLFTLSLLCLPFVGRRAPRLWGLYLGVHVSVFVWYWMSHQDRYLQALVPWMAGCVAVVLSACWRSGWLQRGAVTCLVAVQVAWGLGAYFVPAHSMLGGLAPIEVFARQAARAFRNEHEAILDFLPEYRQVGILAGEGAVVLMHEMTMSLGMGVRTVQDKGVQQSGILYGKQQSCRSLQQLLQSMGVTHLLWDRVGNEESIADELVFRSFVRRTVTNPAAIGSWKLAELPEQPASGALLGDKVVFYACPRDNYEQGLYVRTDLGILPLDGRPASEYPRPRIPAADREALDELTRGADFIVLDPACHAPLGPMHMHAWTRLSTTARELQLWERVEPSSS